MMGYTRVVDTASDKIRDDVVRRDSDGAIIPADPLNHDWQIYQAWLNAGNAPAAPAAAPEPARP